MGLLSDILAHLEGGTRPNDPELRKQAATADAALDRLTTERDAKAAESVQEAPKEG